MGAHAPRSQAASKQKAVQGPRPGRYTGKTTAGNPSPTGVNQVFIQAQRSVSRHRLELTVVGFNLVVTCVGTSNAVVSVYAGLPKPLDPGQLQSRHVHDVPHLLLRRKVAYRDSPIPPELQVQQTV